MIVCSGVSDRLVPNRFAAGDLVAGSLLDHLDVETRADLLACGVRRSFAGDQVLFWFGDPTDHVFLLVEGWVRVSASARGGQEILYALRGPGDVLGEIAALQGWTRTATVRAVSHIRVVQFKRKQFMRMLEERPAITIAMAKQMAGRLREAEAARVDAATLDVFQRLTTFLQRLADQHGVPRNAEIVIDMPLTQQDIANQVGASLRAVNRAMKLLRERGIVSTVARRTIVVRRPTALRAFAHSDPGPPARDAPYGAQRA
jgi:CRP-like cAMP-binding protein